MGASQTERATAPRHTRKSLRKREIALPSLPTVAMRLLETLGSDRATTAQIADIISHDASLATKVLHFANSGYYRRANEVTSVKRAVALIGQSTVQALAIGGTIFGLFGSQKDELRGLWHASLQRACLCHAISSRDRPGVVAEAYLIGLLSRLGSIVSLVLSDKKEPEPIPEHLCMDVVLDRWQLPPIIASPLQKQFEKSTTTSTKNDMEWLAVVGRATRDWGQATDPSTWSHVLRSPETVETIVKDALSAFEANQSAYGSGDGDAKHLLELLKHASQQPETEA